MTDRGIILPASVVRMIYIPLSLSFSLCLRPSLSAFPEEESGCRITERSLCETHRAMLWPQIHDHCNVSRCQSSCINIIRWPSFNYGGVAISLFATVIRRRDCIRLLFNSIRILSDTVHPARLIDSSRWICILRLLPRYISWFNSGEQSKRVD